MTLTFAEINQIVAGLRVFQRCRDTGGAIPASPKHPPMEHTIDDMEYFEETKPLDDEAIDRLADQFYDLHESNTIAPTDDYTGFVQQIARLTKDGECATCLKPGDEYNVDCPEHEPWDMPNDDAVDTIHSLIDKARNLVGEKIPA